MSDNRYEKVEFRGKTFDRFTMEALKVAERRLGYELTVHQGSYSTSVGASAGTHAGGGAVDLAPYDGARKVRVLKNIGFAAWYRPAITGLWSSHIHAILMGNKMMSAAAARQVIAYLNGFDGLKSNNRDLSYRPDPIPQFVYPHSLNRVQRAHELLADADAGLDGALAVLAGCPQTRVVVHQVRAELALLSESLDAQRARLPVK